MTKRTFEYLTESIIAGLAKRGQYLADKQNALERKITLARLRHERTRYLQSALSDVTAKRLKGGW